MSSYLVLREVSEVLRTILFEQMSADAVTSAIVLNEADIVFTNPTQTAQAGNGRLSLWLYQITENEFLKNQPMLRAPGSEPGSDPHNTLRFPPLANFLVRQTRVHISG